jgi:hypothetical protein
MQTKQQWMTQLAEANRIIGIAPRVKATADREPRPTTMAIFDCEPSTFKPKFDLADEQSELDFVLGCMPIRWRKVTENEDLSKFKEHHILLKKDPADNKKFIPNEVPTDYEGLKKGDVVVMALGGSGDNFAFALSRQAEEIGALLLRCPPFRLKAYREESIKVTPDIEVLDDSFILVQMVKTKPDEFYPVFVRERKLTWMRECYRRRIDCMKARIACEQRLRQRYIGLIFCSAEGKFPEGAVEKEFDKVKASDIVLNALIDEENSANRALEKACKALPVFTEVFGQVEGCGPAISSRLISAIQDIRRFETKWKLRKFCGVHCLTDGRFPRRRTGEMSNWSPDCRQALFLLGDQFNRQSKKGTLWGEKLHANKAFYRAKYPMPMEVENGSGKKVKKYTDGHISKMALWKTLGEFVEWLFEEWWNLERKHALQASSPSSTDYNADSEEKAA